MIDTPLFEVMRINNRSGKLWVVPFASAVIVVIFLFATHVVFAGTPCKKTGKVRNSTNSYDIARWNLEAWPSGGFWYSYLDSNASDHFIWGHAEHKQVNVGETYHMIGFTNIYLFMLGMTPNEVIRRI